MNQRFLDAQIVSGRMRSSHPRTSWWTRHSCAIQNYALSPEREDRATIRGIVGSEAKEWESFRPRNRMLAGLLAEHSNLEMGLADATELENATAIDRAGNFLVDNLKEQLPLLDAIAGFPTSLYYKLVIQHVALFSEWLRMGELRRAAHRRMAGARDKNEWIERQRANTISLAYVSTEWL